MDKGVSPVIAVVLLVAIAVIAAVGVWYWVGGLASKPAGVDTVQQSFTVEDCLLGVEEINVRVRNTGGVTIDIEEVPVYDGTQEVGTLNLSDVGAYNIEWVNFSSENPHGVSQGVTYEVVHGQLPSVSFTCKGKYTEIYNIDTNTSVNINEEENLSFEDYTVIGELWIDGSRVAFTDDLLNGTGDYVKEEMENKLVYNYTNDFELGTEIDLAIKFVVEAENTSEEDFIRGEFEDGFYEWQGNVSTIGNETAIETFITMGEELNYYKVTAYFDYVQNQLWDSS